MQQQHQQTSASSIVCKNATFYYSALEEQHTTVAGKQGRHAHPTATNFRFQAS